MVHSGEGYRVRDSFGIGQWDLLTTRRGHFLAFNASLAGAERLVGAVDETHLGVRAWGESFRPTRNGEFYDWYLLLKFRGRRDECLRMLNELLCATEADEAAADDQSRGEEPPSSKSFWQRAMSFLPLVHDEPQSSSGAADPGFGDQQADDDLNVRPIHKLVVNFDTGAWPAAGVLSELGYKVGRSGLGPEARRHVLRTALTVKLVAGTSETDSYVREWGPPKSRQRSDKIERCLTGFANNARRRSADMSEAIADWEEDLQWFRNECHR